MELLERLNEYLRLRALPKKAISRNQLEIMGPMIPVNEVIGLLDEYRAGQLEKHLDEYDYHAPQRLQTTRNPIN